MIHVEDDPIRLLKGIGKTFKMMTMTIRDEMQARGLNVTREQGMLLKALRQKDGAIQNELAWVTFRDKTSLARLLTKMEKQGLVRREQNPLDKRAKRVFITEAGVELSQRIHKVLVELASRFETKIEEKELETTLRTLKAIQDNLDNEFEI